MIVLRAIEPEKDKEAVLRIWKEIGWLEKGKEDIFDLLLGSQGRNLIAEIDGSPECNVTSTKGTLKYLDRELPMSVVDGVLTSLVARRQGLAARLTAKAVAEDAAEGAAISGLGIFDQGFYNQLGFGTGSYENWFFLDPSSILVDHKARPPTRITKEHWKDVYLSRLNRMKFHGSVDLINELDTRLEMTWPTNTIGFGYYDDEGVLTHHVYFRTDSPGDGNYTLQWMTYQNREQFMELLSVMKSLSDQVHLIIMREPPGIQFQDVLKRPFRHRRLTKGSKYENKVSSSAYWQMRILDLESCVNASEYNGPSVKFNLTLRDPIEDLLEKNSPWRGIGGDHTVTLGPESEIGDGKTPGLPTLKTSVNAFTRMWLGVRPPSSLALTDEIQAPPSLINDLDQVLRLPRPQPDWDF